MLKVRTIILPTAFLTTYEVKTEVEMFDPEKTFMGRYQKGFDLLGYHIMPQGFSPSYKT